MSDRYAVIATEPHPSIDTEGRPVMLPAGTVVNVILWDGVTPHTPAPGTMLRPAGTLEIGARLIACRVERV